MANRSKISIPVPTTVADGQKVSIEAFDTVGAPMLLFTAAPPTIAVQFQESQDETTWTNVGAPVTADGVSASAAPSAGAKYLRAHVTAAGDVGTASAVLGGQVDIPVPITVSDGEAVSIEAFATVEAPVLTFAAAEDAEAPAISVQFQESTDGSTWANLGDPVTESGASVSAAPSAGVKYLRASVTVATEIATAGASSGAEISVVVPITVSDGASVGIDAFDTFAAPTLSVTGDADPAAISVQFQESVDGDNWVSVGSAVTTSGARASAAPTDGARYLRAHVTAANEVGTASAHAGALTRTV